jgi:hypothetical protein
MPIKLSLSGPIGSGGTFLLTRILVLQFQSLFDEIFFMIEIENPLERDFLRSDRAGAMPCPDPVHTCSPVLEQFVNF